MYYTKLLPKWILVSQLDHSWPNTRLIFKIIVLSHCLLFAHAAPLRTEEHVRTKTMPTKDYVKAYLKKYKFLDVEDPTKEDISTALGLFQREVGESETGELNLDTLELMSKPRCGLVDSVPLPHHRTKRFVPHGNKWSHTRLTWKMDDPFDLLNSYDRLVVRNVLHRAFNEWAKASQDVLLFKEIKHKHQKTDINAMFARGYHNDSLPFDGEYGVVAHGFYPQDGKLHFDAAEKWTLNLPDGVNLYQTAVHEIGHLLGLKHSTDKDAVMFPIERPFNPDYKLAEDDIRGIRYLYAPFPLDYFKDNGRPHSDSDNQKSAFVLRPPPRRRPRRLLRPEYTR